MRLIIAGLIGGLVMFFWGFVAHQFLGVGEAGVKSLPNDTAIIEPMKANLTEPGFYFFPGLENMKNASEAEMNAWTERYKAGPNGILIYHPTGDDPLSAKRLLVELISNMAAALVVALLLTWMVPSFSKRILAAALIGLTAWLSINVSYWDWYGFPTGFVLSEAVEQVVGWFLTGLAMAFILRRKETTS